MNIDCTSLVKIKMKDTQQFIYCKTIDGKAHAGNATQNIHPLSCKRHAYTYNHTHCITHTSTRDIHIAKVIK